MDQFLEVSALGARVLLGLVFVLAGFTKARAPAAFASSLGQYRVLPARLRPAVVAALPPVEVLLGAMLIAGAVIIPTAAVAITMLVVFTAASIASPKQAASDCGCFGSFGTLNVKNVVARNVVLTALAIVPIAVGATSYSIESASGIAIALAVAAAFSALILVIARNASTATPVVREASPDGLDRRSFLGKLAMLSVGAAAVAAVSALKGASNAEAACLGCGSCGSQYLWIACTGACCAAFWVAPFDYCAPSCYQCGSWTTQVFCGYSQCCS